MTSRTPAAAVKPVAPAEPAASVELAEIAKLAGGLTPCWTSPLKFHERKSELLMRLRKSARRVASLEAALQHERGG
jgi:hypothetical protein